MIERYVIQPNTIPAVDNLCLVEFAAYYFQEYKTDCINDAQPGILTEDATELHVQLSAKHKFWCHKLLTSQNETTQNQ